MHLSWQEIRARAARFAERWQHAHYEKGETQSFYNEFFAIFDKDRRAVARYEMSVARTGRARGFVDLFWPRTLIVEQKSKGRDLVQAEQQALDYLTDIADHEQPRYILACDFQTFHLTDLETRDSVTFTLDDLPAHVERFAFILGRQTRHFKEQDPVNIRAAELVGHLHDAIAASGYTGHRLEVFLTRIVFCLFADDTGVFEPRDILWDLLDSRTAADGADTGGWLNDLFNTLNTPEAARQTTLDADLARFPYVNGDLFAEFFPAPHFDSRMRAALLNACRFDWTPISPAIFGALFQSVMDPAERRAVGAHYTTEQNILKVIEPLFLDDLRAEFAHLKSLRTGRRRRLRAFHDKLAGLSFFDPACGCGNFLVIAYRELRRLELELLRELRGDSQRELDAALISRVDVDQFYGIEIGEFPARIAETALWMMDHLMNRDLSEAFGRVFTRIPLKKSPTIVNADALEVDWAGMLAPERCDYLFGNPPFVGAKYQAPAQREQVRRIADLGKSGGTLDYVCAWFITAGQYVQGQTRIGFVATNSITQGEQVGQLWPVLLDRCGLEIAFAHRTFAWGSDARGMAHVHVVVIGLDRAENARAETRLFSYADVKGTAEEERPRALSPYLIDASGLANPHLVVREEHQPINGMRPLRFGSQPIDGRNLILSGDERELLLAKHPEASEFVKPFIGAREYLQGKERYILDLHGASPERLKKFPEVVDRIRRVRESRLNSKRPATRELARTPQEFAFKTIPDAPFLIVPGVSSERREYAPFGFESPPTIPSNLVNVLLDATLPDFALLTSAMHMAWLRQIGGRLESRYRYSIGLVYNTFPLPESDLSKLTRGPRCRTSTIPI